MMCPLHVFTTVLVEAVMLCQFTIVLGADNRSQCHKQYIHNSYHIMVNTCEIEVKCTCVPSGEEIESSIEVCTCNC